MRVHLNGAALGERIQPGTGGRAVVRLPTIGCRKEDEVLARIRRGRNGRAVPTILSPSIARKIVTADGCAVSPFDRDKQAWRIRASQPISSEFAAAVVDSFVNRHRHLVGTHGLTLHRARRQLPSAPAVPAALTVYLIAAVRALARPSVPLR